MTAKPFSLNLTNLLLLAVLFAVSLSVGVADFRWSDVFSLSDSQQVMFISRLPRTFAIVLTGASMAVAGMIMQILMRNRFVEPSMAGAGQSAALGLLLMSLLLPAAPLPVKMSVAAVAALIGMLVFMLLIRRLPPTAQLMVPLVGIIFGGVVEAVATFIAYENEMLQMLGVWQQGDFSSVLLGRYELLWITGGLAVFAYLIADRLTILGLGRDGQREFGFEPDGGVVVGFDYCGFDYVAGYRYGRQYSVCRAGRAEHHQPPDRRQAAPKPACGGFVGRVFGVAVRYFGTRDCVSV